jgi:hypothetical protein
VLSAEKEAADSSFLVVQASEKQEQQVPPSLDAESTAGIAEKEKILSEAAEAHHAAVAKAEDQAHVEV